MRNLRQLFRRSGLLSADSRRRRSEKKLRNDVSQRRLSNEVLEKRELLAGDILAPNHNYWNRYDVNDDGAITARDALAVINKLGVEAEAELASAEGPTMFYDVNADSQITAADALSVINATSRGEEVGELVELMLTARDDNDAPLAVDANGDVNIGVNEPFNLEVSYDDLRLFNERLGVFQLFTDISVSQSNVLVPILNETQRLIIDGAVTSSPFPTSLTFSIPESPPGITGDLSFTASFNDFANGGQATVISALTAFGYTTDQFTVTALDFGNSDQGFEIHWVGNEFGNVDLPNISVEVDEAAGDPDIPTQTVEFAPFEADGTTPNSDAVRFNINTFSRTFNTNEQFYSSQNRGAFDPASGFIGAGGLGQVPTGGGGIPQLTDDGGFIEPFDAFSLRVMITQPVTDLVVGVNPGEDAEATLLYGRDDAVPQDMVLIETTDSNGNGIANVTINASNDTGLPLPLDGALSTNEDVAGTLDLSTIASNFDSVAIATNGSNGIASISGNILTYTPNADFNGTDTVTYTATNGAGSATATVTVTIDPVQDAPVANADSQSTAQDTVLTIQAATLLANDVDVDGDTLTITAVGNPTNTNATAVLNGTTITYTPASGFSGTDTFDYTISDGTATSTATVTVNVGAVLEAPILADTSASLAAGGSATIDLSTLLSGGTPDTLTVTTNPANGTATISGNILTYTPNAGFSGDNSVVVTAANTAGSDTGTISLTVVAAGNNNPVAVNDTVSAVQDTALVIAGTTLLSNDSDPDGDTITVTAVGAPTNSGATAVLSGTNITYTPASGSVASDSFTYTISDGNGGTATATVTVNVSSNLVAPIAGDGNLGVTQNQAATLDLSNLLSGGAADTITVTTNGTQGSASISGTTLTYTPNSGATGSDTIVYTATNGAGSDSGTISLTISAVFAAGDSPLAVVEDNTASIDLASLVSGGTADSFAISANGSNGSAAISGTTLTYTPNADFFGSDTVVYSATSGSGTDTATITVTVSSVNDAPNAVNDTATAFTGSTTDITVLSNDNAGPANENQALTVTAASSSNGTATVNADGTIAFTPSAGFTGNTTISYTIQDSDGASDSAVVNVAVQDFVPSTISGAIFIDHVENIQELLAGASPIRNGAKDSDEKGLSGVQIQLVSQTTGDTVAAVFTDLDGGYSFENVAPGDYQVVYDVPSTVIFTGSPTQDISIGSTGGVTQGGMNFALLGTTGSAMHTVDILAASYLRTNVTSSQLSDGGREGGVVSLDSDGNQNFFIAGSGFEDALFAEVVLNQNRDAALLTIVEDNGDVLTARLSSDQFVVSQDGTGVQFFGGRNDFQFANADADLIEQEFANFRNAIDQILGS